MKYLYLFCLIISSSAQLLAQDILVKKNGDVFRGTILGTDFRSVKYSVDDAAPIISGLKDIKEFVWNGESYVTKTFFNGKKAEDRFVRIVETGVVNLYSVGGLMSTETIAPTGNKPRFGVGLGTGGVGASIQLGRQRAPESAQPRQVKTIYFIEKPGTGAIQELNLGNITGLRSILLQKLGDDEDLATRIKTLTELDGRGLIAFIKAYNAAKPQP